MGKKYDANLIVIGVGLGADPAGEISSMEKITKQ